ncbi:MAG: hypothetical protein EON47_15280 [Acetobacteraceae bacterium]|nr:MAG: hypothetical protein EON47_15280 [Acetobacteraceae bacterium]
MKTEIPEAQRRRLEKLAALPDAAIDTSDIPEVADWSEAVRGGLYKPRKEAITIRLDADVLAWFKAQAADGITDGRGYQSEINRVLRQHVATQVGGATRS